MGDRSQNSLYLLNFSKLSSLINSKSFHFHPMINNVFFGGGGGGGGGGLFGGALNQNFLPQEDANSKGEWKSC